MNVTIYTQVPAGFKPTPELRIFSPVNDPTVCVMAQQYEDPWNQFKRIWVAIPTDRVDKIKFVTAPAGPDNVIDVEEVKG